MTSRSSNFLDPSRSGRIDRHDVMNTTMARPMTAPTSPWRADLVLKIIPNATAAQRRAAIIGASEVCAAGVMSSRRVESSTAPWGRARNAAEMSSSGTASAAVRFRGWAGSTGIGRV